MFPPILGFSTMVPDCIKSGQKAFGNRNEITINDRLSVAIRFDQFRFNFKKHPSAETIHKYIRTSIDHTAFNPSPNYIANFVREKRVAILVGSFIRVDTDSLLSLIKNDIISFEQAVEFVKHAVVGDPCDLIVVLMASYLNKKRFSWAIDLIEHAEFGDACNAAFRLCLMSTRIDENGIEKSTRLINWAKAILKFRPLGNPSAAAVMMYVSKIADFEFMKSVIDNDKIGDPCGAIYQFGHLAKTQEEKTKYLKWLKEMLLQCTSGDPCYWLSKEKNLCKDIDLVRQVVGRKVGTVPGELLRHAVSGK